MVLSDHMTLSQSSKDWDTVMLNVCHLEPLKVHVYCLLVEKFVLDTTEQVQKDRYFHSQQAKHTSVAESCKRLASSVVRTLIGSKH